jgi:hypothetical protein
MRRVTVVYAHTPTGQRMHRIPDRLADRFGGYARDEPRLWGAAELERLDAWWLPQLRGRTLSIPVEALAAFRAECTRALDAADRLAAESGCPEADIRQALRNFLRATDEAEAIGGWVEVR